MEFTTVEKTVYKVMLMGGTTVTSEAKLSLTESAPTLSQLIEQGNYNNGNVSYTSAVVTSDGEAVKVSLTDTLPHDGREHTVTLTKETKSA